MTQTTIVRLPFNPIFRELMLSGKKTATTRAHPYGFPGELFQVFGATFAIRGLRYTTLGYVAENYYDIEGFETEENFREFWKRLHPVKGFDPLQKVAVHIFEKVSLS